MLKSCSCHKYMDAEAWDDRVTYISPDRLQKKNALRASRSAATCSTGSFSSAPFSLELSHGSSECISSSCVLKGVKSETRREQSTRVGLQAVDSRILRSLHGLLLGKKGYCPSFRIPLISVTICVQVTESGITRT